MPIQLPEQCPRERGDCSALYNIESDPDFEGDPKTFICVGLNDGSTRTVDQDVFRKCVKAGSIDTLEDCDRRDLTDEALVILQGLSIAENIAQALDEEGED